MLLGILTSYYTFPLVMLGKQIKTCSGLSLITSPDKLQVQSQVDSWRYAPIN